MKIKTSELSGEQLDWAVAKCEGQEVVFEDGELCLPSSYFKDGDPYKPSTNWGQGGPIIEREEIKVGPQIHSGWESTVWENCRPISSKGPTPLVAAMRCYVASKLGDEIEIPEEMTNERTV